MIKVGSDFSGVGAFNQALNRLGLEYCELFACDKDKYARQTFIENYGYPVSFPTDVYDREIPAEPLDIYMTSPPCQAFSVAGKRLGKDDQRGILFFNSHEFIKANNPRYFIFENVKGLLSDDDEKTFSEWINMLGGKSVNGLPVLFPYEDSVPYHIYYSVLNSKNHNVPQSRERVFIVGIRDDIDNNFTWPKKEYLSKKLKDILEHEVDDKYMLSEKAKNHLLKKQDFNKFKIFDDESESSNTITARCNKVSNDNTFIKVAGNTNPSGNGINGRVYDADGISPTLSTNKGEGIKIVSYSRCQRTGEIKKRNLKNVSNTIHASTGGGGNTDQYLAIPVLTPERAEKRQNGRRFKNDGDPSFTVTTQDRHGVYDGYNIRRLTPRECFRLMDFPDTFTWSCSDSQAYKQAGNSIVVKCLELIIKQFKL